MFFTSSLRNWKRSTSAARRRIQTSLRQPVGFGTRLEALEDRRLFSVLTVTNLLDSGAGSLRAEIAAAQSGDTIVFSLTSSASPALATSLTLSGSLAKSSSSKTSHGKKTPPPPLPPPPPPTITLTTGQLLLDKNLTIQGPGASQLIVTGSTSSRAFEVEPTAAVTLSGLTISGSSSYWGTASWAGYGGGILNHGTLAMSGCTIGGAIVSHGEGGGIFNDGTLSVVGCTVSNGRAEGDDTNGGGISNWGDATLNNTVISNNAADPGLLTYPWFNKGGGIFNSGTMTLNGCTVTSNVARTAGGGIFNGGTLILSGTQVFSNSSSYGGGVYSAGTMTLKNASSITDVDNVGSLNVLDTSSISNLYSNPAWLYPVYE